jgi:hypothetical protein
MTRFSKASIFNLDNGSDGSGDWWTLVWQTLTRNPFEENGQNQWPGILFWSAAILLFAIFFTKKMAVWAGVDKRAEKRE